MSQTTRLPDGQIMENIPDGMTKHELAEKLGNKYGTQRWTDEWNEMQASRQRELQTRYPGIGGFPARAAAETTDWLANNPAFKLGPTASFFARPAAKAATGLVGMGGDVMTGAMNMMAGAETPYPEGRNQTNFQSLYNTLFTGRTDPKQALGQPSNALARIVDAYTTAPKKTQEKWAEEFNTLLMGGVFGPKMRSLFQASPEVRQLAERGVITTPGQRAEASSNPIAQGLGKIEEGVSRIPVIGSFISHARESSVAQAARAQVDEAMRIAGEPLAPRDITVLEAVNRNEAVLDGRYDRLFARMRGNFRTKAWQQPNSETFEETITNVGMEAQQQLTTSATRRAMQNIMTRLVKQFDANGDIRGDAIKDMQRYLRHEEHRFRASQNPEQQDVADYVARMREGFNEMLRRSNNPDDVRELNTLDRAWAQHVMTREAATATTALKKGRNIGAFTPNAMLEQVARRVKRGGTARGQKILMQQAALGQRLAQTSAHVLGNRLPDSGTPYGMAVQEILASGGGALAGGAPGAVLGAAAVPAIYNPWTLRILQNAALRNREALSKFGVVGGAYGEGKAPFKEDYVENPLLPGSQR